MFDPCPSASLFLLSIPLHRTYLLFCKLYVFIFRFSDHTLAIANYLASESAISLLQDAKFAAEVGVPFVAPPPLAKAHAIHLQGVRFILRGGPAEAAAKLDAQYRTEPHEQHLHFAAILNEVVRKAVLCAIGESSSPPTPSSSPASSSSLPSSSSSSLVSSTSSASSVSSSNASTVTIPLSASGRAACAAAARREIVPWTRPPGAPVLPPIVPVQLPVHIE